MTLAISWLVPVQLFTVIVPYAVRPSAAAAKVPVFGNLVAVPLLRFVLVFVAPPVVPETVARVVCEFIVVVLFAIAGVVNVVPIGVRPDAVLRTNLSSLELFCNLITGLAELTSCIVSAVFVN